jgi:hypothetical protein
MSAKHIIGISVAVTLFTVGTAPNVQARTDEDSCPTYACPGVFGEGECGSVGSNELCLDVGGQKGCMRSLQFSMCSAFGDCDGGMGAYCQWS